MNEWVAVVFSKNRPLQLDLTLTSLYSQCKDIDDVTVIVLYTVSDAKYLSSYRTLMSEHPEVLFVKEGNFKSDLVTILSDKTHVLFVVDDCVFVREFCYGDIAEFIDDDKMIGFSLRLSPNVEWCYPAGVSQHIPTIVNDDIWSFQKGMLHYNWIQSRFDFQYPLELSSSVYKVERILEIIKTKEYHHPNSLESAMESSRRDYTSFPHLGCYEKSVAFCIPMNKVQSTHNNKDSGNSKYSPSNLLTIFEKGVRIDAEKLYNWDVTSPHMEIDFLKFAKE